MSLPKILTADYKPNTFTKSHTKVQYLSQEISNMQFFVLVSKSFLI